MVGSLKHKKESVLRHFYWNKIGKQPTLQIYRKARPNMSNHSNAVFVIEGVQAVLGKEGELYQALEQLARIVRKQPGCLRYEIFQSKNETGLFLVTMEFKSEVLLEAHEKSSYLANFIQNREGILYTEVSFYSRWLKS